MQYISPLSLTLAAIAVSNLPQLCQATCRSFSPVGNPYNNEQVYTSTGRTLVVSEVVNCTGPNLGSQPPSWTRQMCNSTTCAVAIPSDYYARVNSTLNVTVSSDADLRNIFDLAKLNVTQLQSQSSPTDFNITMVHEVSATSTCMTEGLGGYWGFTPIMNCVQGLLHGCTGDTSNLEGAAVTVCGVQMLDRYYKKFDGHIGFVYIYGLTVDGRPAPANATMTGTNPLPTGGAATVGVNVLGTLAVLATVAILVF